MQDHRAQELRHFSSPLFHRDLGLIDLDHFVLNYVNTFELEYNVSFLQSQMKDIAKNLVASPFFTRSNPHTSIRNTSMANMLVRTTDVLNLFKQKCNRKGGDHDPSVIPVDGSTTCIHVEGRKDPGPVFGNPPKQLLGFLSTRSFNLLYVVQVLMSS